MQFNRAEQAALMNYTRGANYLERGQKQLIIRLIAKSVIPDRITVYRGARGSVIRRFKVGNSYTRLELTSTSTRKSVAYDHSDYADPGTLEIHIPKGSHGLRIPNKLSWGAKSEFEMLLGPHSYTVKSKEKIGNRWHAVVELNKSHVALADDPSMQQGNVLGKPSMIYYTRLGMNAYREIQRDFGADPEFQQGINEINEKKLSRLAKKKLRKHPLYPRMQYYLDMARKSEQSMRTPIRNGTMTDGAPHGLYYNELQYGFPRSGM